MPLLMPLGRATVGRLGMNSELLDYADPWADIPLDVLSRLPADLPRCPAGYIEATGRALTGSAPALSAA
jgi:hypothetical protein